MRNALRNTALAAVLVLIAISSAVAQQIRFESPNFFSSVAFLQMNGAQQAQYNGQYVLRLTPGTDRNHNATGTTWFTIPQVVNSGFTTYFRFQIHNATCCTPGDGLAFVVQNSATTDTSYGTNGKGGLLAVGVGNGGIGYAGIPNSLAIEFDTLESFDVEGNSWDPTVDGNNHVAVQGCGTLTNGPVHVAGTFTIGQNNKVKSCLVNSGLNNCPGPNNCGNLPPLPHLGVTCNGETCADGTPHDVVIEYARVGCPKDCVWTLNVYVDPRFITNTHTPVPGTSPTISIPYNIDNTQNPTTGLFLKNKTSAWVGFAASQTTQPQQQDILAWEFTPHAPTSITQTIQGCPSSNPNCTPPPTVFTFGGHDTKATLFQGYQNPNGDQMTVVATPISRSAFFQTRLKGTPFSNEQCVVYQGTGNNCIVYTVTCQDSGGKSIKCPEHQPDTCPNGSTTDPTCYQFETSYYTADGVTTTNADYLKADPPGVNSKDWHSIFNGFSSTIFDPRTSGSGGTPSDFVATFRVGAQP